MIRRQALNDYLQIGFDTSELALIMTISTYLNNLSFWIFNTGLQIVETIVKNGK